METENPLETHIVVDQYSKMQTSGDESLIAAVAPPIHGDVLEAVLSHLPLLHLLPASLVSKTWYKIVSFILLKSQKSKPWLILHTQRTRSPYLTTAEAYDPATNLWIEIHQPPIEYVSALRSNQSNLLYMLSTSKFAFSFDPLHLTWHDAVAPEVWRIDPIVAVVGNHVVVAGGSCDFEQDPLAVEIYDIELRKWTKPEPMPEFFNEFASSIFLSIASDDRRLFVVEKNSGVLHTFDPVTKTWNGPYDLRPDNDNLVFHFSIGYFSDDRLILIGMLGDINDLIGVKVWKVNCESFDCVEIAEMPADLVAKLKGDDLEISSIEVRMAGNIGYIYKPWLVEEVIVCEFCDSGECRWRSTAASDRSSVIERCVFTCSMVGIEELRRATRSTVNRRFRFKRNQLYAVGNAKDIEREI